MAHKSNVAKKATATATCKNTAQKPMGKNVRPTAHSNKRVRDRSPEPQQSSKKAKGTSKSTRHSMAAPIVSESDDEDVPFLECLRRGIHNVVDDDAILLSSVVLGNDDELAADGKDEDLQHLNGKDLHDAFEDKHPQWGYNDGSDNNEPPALKDISNESDQDDESDDDDEVNNPHKVGHRVAQRQAERPQWQAAEEMHNVHNNDNIKVDDINAGWDIQAHYVLPKPHACMIGLLKQPGPYYDVLKASINIVTGDALSFQKIIAKKLKYPLLAECIGQDASIGKEGGRLLNHQVGNMRGRAKAAVSSTIGGDHGIQSLGTFEECTAVVKARLDEGDYIYPVLSTGKLIDTKPYYHPCMIAGIQKFFFLGSCSTYNHRFHSHFTSSLLEYPEEWELPSSLVSIIATAIHASLVDWLDGVHRPTDFNYDLLEDIYNGHEEFLSDLCKEYPGKYHVLMHGLYNVCSSSGQADMTAAIAQKNRKHLNLDGMGDVVAK